MPIKILYPNTAPAGAGAAFLNDYLAAARAPIYGGARPQLIYCPHCRYVGFTTDQIDRHCRQVHNESEV